MGKKKSRFREQKSKNNPFKGTRGTMPKPGFRHRDERKVESKKACRGKVEW